ncbi:MAG: hypothetical protein WD178_05275 [Actinomycetota bacterium]
MNGDKTKYRLGAAVAVASAVFLFVVAAGVGIIGADGDRANMMYLGVLAVGIVGALIARFKPLGMARALIAMAVAHVVVGAIALIAGLGRPASPPLEILGLTGMFAVLFVGSAWLFEQAAKGGPKSGAA